MRSSRRARFKVFSPPPSLLYAFARFCGLTTLRNTERGCIYTVKVTSHEDLNRQLVKSGTCTITIPEYELTIPASRGQLTTVEGVISDTVRDLELGQPLRKHTQPEVHDKIEALLAKLRPAVSAEEDNDERISLNPFTVRLDDPSGNSFIEVKDGLNDPKWSKREYTRTKEQNVQLGLAADDGTTGGGKATTAAVEKSLTDDMEVVNPDEVLSFPSTCPSCNQPLDTFMKPVKIPHFKVRKGEIFIWKAQRREKLTKLKQDVMIMSTACDNCGYRDNEIKSGGAISPQGRKVTLRVEDSEDLSRDILKVRNIPFRLHPSPILTRTDYRAIHPASRSPRSTSSSIQARSAVGSPRSRASSAKSTRSSTPKYLPEATRPHRKTSPPWNSFSPSSNRSCPPRSNTL
jgi:C4-type Zn-finger protein